VTLTAVPSSLVQNDTATLTAVVAQFNDAPAPTSYAWDCKGDGVTVVTTSSNTQSCAYPTAGTITSKVTVPGAAFGTASTTVIVAAAAPLLVAITANPNATMVNAPVIFTATVTSTGPVPPTLRWEWDDEGDGTYEIVISSAANPNVRTTSYGSVGVRTIKVRVTDPATGRVVTGTRAITVS
jgi:PKD repeat protein